MSRWSKRTQEEKEAILKKQDEQQKHADFKKDKMNILSLDWRLKILKGQELPLFCPKCGWTPSDTYTTTMRKDMFGKTKYVQGKCKKCNKSIETTIPLNSVYTTLFLLVMNNLKRVGRLKEKWDENQS